MQSSKELARIFIKSRVTNPQPLPTQEEIRRKMGWNLIPKKHV